MSFKSINRHLVEFGHFGHFIHEIQISDVPGFAVSSEENRKVTDNPIVSYA